MNQQHKRFRPRPAAPNHSGNSTHYAPRNDRNLANLQRKVFDSAGPDGRVRGTALQVYEKYLAQARDFNSSGDRVNAENCLQHAEHYLRILNSGQPRTRNLTHHTEDDFIMPDEEDRFADLRRNVTSVPAPQPAPEQPRLQDHAPVFDEAAPAPQRHTPPREHRQSTHIPRPAPSTPPAVASAYAAPQPSMLFAAPPIVPVSPPAQAALPKPPRHVADIVPHDDGPPIVVTMPDDEATETAAPAATPRRRVMRRRTPRSADSPPTQEG